MYYWVGSPLTSLSLLNLCTLILTIPSEHTLRWYFFLFPIMDDPPTLVFWHFSLIQNRLNCSRPKIIFSGLYWLYNILATSRIYKPHILLYPHLILTLAYHNTRRIASFHFKKLLLFLFNSTLHMRRKGRIFEWYTTVHSKQSPHIFWYFDSLSLGRFLSPEDVQSSKTNKNDQIWVTP